MTRVFFADLLKIRRKLVWFLIFLGPFGVIALQYTNFTLRYDYLTKLYKNHLWEGLLSHVHYLTVPVLLLGMTIITSMIANIEHQKNGWKQILALPVSKMQVFLSKFWLSFLLLLISCFLLAVGSILLGLVLGFGMNIPYAELASVCFFPAIAGLPVLVVQLWLAVIWKNQALPFTVGILGMILSMYGMKMPDWVPWKWPLLENTAHDPLYFVIAGSVCGFVVLVMSILDFSRRDVN